jgi:hypothetical protein
MAAAQGRGAAQEQDSPQPDSDQAGQKALLQAAELVAGLMDSVFRIPGTTFRVGLDPLVGLIPGIGDALASVIGSTILLLAQQLGVPRIVQVRMAINVLLNGLIGAIPGLGDVFSFWFKSNVRNARLLRLHASERGRTSTTADWVFVLGLICGVLVLLGLTLLAGIWLISRIWRAVS